MRNVSFPRVLRNPRTALVFFVPFLTLASTASAQQWNGPADTTSVITRTGDVGIGSTAIPASKLDVTGTLEADTRFRLTTANTQLVINEDGDSPDFIRFRPAVGLGFFFSSSGDQPRLVVRAAGKVGIHTKDPATELDVNGTTRTKVLEITGGSDLAEPFVVHGASPVVPGMVVSLDPADPSRLQLSSEAYDRKVVGIISGAGGIQPGMIMGPDAGDPTRHPVAMTGRVYVKADTLNGPIQPGDLLTSSARAGQASRVADYEKAQGAILGKAMTALADGEGMVLVLVSLQ